MRTNAPKAYVVRPAAWTLDKDESIEIKICLKSCVIVNI